MTLTGVLKRTSGGCDGYASENFAYKRKTPVVNIVHDQKSSSSLVN